MRILLDHCTPVPLGRHLSEHSVQTAARRGWATLRNGDLLNRAETAGYELLITTDQSMRYQQNMSDRKISIIILLSNSWPRIRLQTDRIREAVTEISVGQISEVEIPIRTPDR